jgi:hypothetical protein
LRSLCAVSIVERVKVEIDHFTQGPKSYVLTMTWLPT